MNRSLLVATCLFLLAGAGSGAAPALEVELPEMSGGGAAAGAGAAAVANPCVVPPPPPSATPPTLGTTFDGPDFDDNGVQNSSGTLKIPPDPMGAAGKDRLVAVVNTMIEARTKAGTQIFIDSLKDFFAPLAPTTDTFDPKIVYDPYEDRFVVVTLERVIGPAPVHPANVSRILLAVSKTGAPATATPADWHYAALNGKVPIFGGAFDGWADYPGFEVDEEAIYVTANIFTFVPFGFFGGTRLWIVDKGVGGGFFAGGAAASSVHDFYAATGISGFATTTMPAQVHGAGGVGPGIGSFLVSYSGLTTGGPGGPEALNIFRVNDPLGTPSFTQEFLIVSDLENVGGIFGFPPLPDAPQSGTGVLVEVNDRRTLDAVWRDDQLWLTTTIDPNSGPDAGTTTAHWFRLDTSAVTSSASPAGLVTLADEGNIGAEDVAPGTYTFFPSVAANRYGEVKFGFSASAPSIFPGAFVTGRQPGDPPGTVQATETVRAGMDYYVRTFGSGRNRWGDYSGIAVDPADERRFWVFNEYAAARGTLISGEDGRWGTAWGSCRFGPECPCYDAATLSQPPLFGVCRALGPWSGGYAQYQGWPFFSGQAWMNGCWFSSPYAPDVVLPVTPAEYRSCRQTLLDAAGIAGVPCLIW